MIVLVFYILAISFLYPIGMQGLVLPSSPESYLTNQTGIANSNFNFENPASLNSDQSEVRLGVSSNKWINGLQGNSAYYRSGLSLVRFYSVGIDDIELRDETASEDPMGLFGTHFLALEYSRALKLPLDLLGGYKVHINYIDLLLDSMYGIAVDLSAIKVLSPRINLGVLIKNIGYEETNGLQASLPQSYGIGIFYKIPVIEGDLLYDHAYLDTRGWGEHISIAKSLGVFNISVGYCDYGEVYQSYSYGLDVMLSKSWGISYSVISHQHLSTNETNSIGLSFFPQ